MVRTPACRHPLVHIGVVAIALLVTVASISGPTRPALSTSYGDLVTLFHEWRAFQPPKRDGWVPDYTADAMARQHGELRDYQKRLAMIDPGGWTVQQQVDYHIVRAEMNGLDFDHRVMRPWARMPGFYKVVLPSQTDVPAREGQVMYGAIELWSFEAPLDSDVEHELTARIAAIPAILEQARRNLVGDGRDLWHLGIRTKERESRALETYAERMRAHHPGLADEALRAKRAVDDFRDWLVAELPSKDGTSGIGIENYDWHLRHVQLVPYTWAEQVTLIQRQLDRSWAYLSLGENRTRNRQRLEEVATEAEYQMRYREAVRDFVAFLRDEEIFTPAGYEESALLAREGGFQSSPSTREFFTRVNYRDLRPMRAHATHWFDLARLAADPPASPIRGVPLYNIWASRAEGLATGFEEMMTEAGFLDAPELRQLVWVLLAQRSARALAELRLHANEMTLDEAVDFMVSRTPHDWLTREGTTAWGELQLYLEQPSYGTSYVIGKIQLDQLIAERRRQLGDQFSLRAFMDEFHAAGLIPLSLITWEMTGSDHRIQSLLHH